MATFTLGADPEFMIVGDKGNLLSAVEVVPSTSEKRKKIKGHEFYHDNVLAECAIKPASSKEGVIASFRECFGIYADLVKPHTLVCRASGTYAEDQLQTEAARLAGCDPEACAYTQDFLPKPDEQFMRTGFRSAGGHIHIGCDGDVWHTEVMAHYPIKMMDLFVGIPAIFLDHDPTSKQRKELYGSAGSMRRKPYGIEYRPLSNFWLASPKLVGLIYDLCEFVVEFVNLGRYEEFWTVNQAAVDNYELPEDCYFCKGYDSDKLRDAINTGSKAKGKPFMRLVEQYMPPDLVSRVMDMSKPSKTNFYKEWGI